LPSLDNIRHLAVARDIVLELLEPRGQLRARPGAGFDGDIVALGQGQRQRDRGPVLLVPYRHPPPSVFLELAVGVAAGPLNRQALKHRQEKSEIELPLPRQLRQPFHHLITYMRCGEDRRGGLVCEHDGSAAANAGREDDVGVSDERAGKLGNRS
jgi:hypothetical protein